MNWLLIALIVVAGFLLIRYGKGLLSTISKLLKDNVAAFATVIVVFIVALLVIIMFQPQVFVGSAGIFGSALKGAKAEANLKTAVLDPRDNPDIWDNKKLAEKVKSDLDVEIAKNKAAIVAANAEAGCYGGRDPDCENSLSPREQVIKKSIGNIAENVGDELRKIDLAATDKELSKPLGQAPADANPAIKPMYDIPKGFVWIAFLFVGLIILGRIAISALRIVLW